MRTPLLLAAPMAWFLGVGHQFHQSAPPAWPLERVGDRCPEFRDESGRVKIASCRVSESGEFASFQGDTFYYALYCAEEKAFPDAGSCNDPDSLNSRHERSNAAVFVRHGRATNVHLVVSVFEGFGGEFRKPRIVETSQGTVMELPFSVGVSCDCNASTYYLWNAQTRDWELMDWESWQKDLAKAIPPQLRARDSFWPDLAALSAGNALWREDDPHCCPTGGFVYAQLGIVGKQFVLKSVSVKANR
jgi:hypothetical protein